MKIKFKQKYISIEEFESIDVNDFTILTGKNGSGKTHFLNAIKQGSIEIEGIQKSEIVYYNYNDFTVFSGNLQQNVQYKNKSSTWLNEKQEYLNKIQLLKSKAIQLVAYEQKSLDQILFNFTQQASFDFNNYFNLMDKLNLKTAIGIGLLQTKTKEEMMIRLLFSLYKVLIIQLKVNNCTASLHHMNM